jgi:hypothetical protein
MGVTLPLVRLVVSGAKKAPDKNGPMDARREVPTLVDRAQSLFNTGYFRPNFVNHAVKAGLRF